MKTTTCKGCGRKIVYAAITKADGSPGSVPLDPSAPTYFVTQSVDGTLIAARTTSVFVSHFSTCSQASLFSGKNAKREEGGS
jgi:hypothetical protein